MMVVMVEAVLLRGERCCVRDARPVPELARADAELSTDVGQVVLHSVDAGAAATGDLSAANAVAHEIEHPPLGGCQNVRDGVGCRGRDRGSLDASVAGWTEFPYPRPPDHDARAGPVRAGRMAA